MKLFVGLDPISISYPDKRGNNISSIVSVQFIALNNFSLFHNAPRTFDSFFSRKINNAMHLPLEFSTMNVVGDCIS